MKTVQKRNTGARTMSAGTLTVTALFTALVCIATMVVQIPIPLGYVHLGNAVILLTSWLFGAGPGAFAAGAGSALADLFTGYAYWSLPTLLIKGCMGFVIGKLVYSKKKERKLFGLRTLLGAVSGIGIMISGYFLAGSLIYGSFYTGALQIPGLATEGVLGIVLFYLLAAILKESRFRRMRE